MQKEIRKTISKIKETGLQLLFPGRCPVCDGIVRPFGRKICPECLPKLKPVTAPWCMRCGKKLAEEREYCGDCMHRELYTNTGMWLRQSIVLSIVDGRNTAIFSEKKWRVCWEILSAGCVRTL